MFKALTNMMRTPIAILPYLGTDTNGDKMYGDPIYTKCLVESRVSIVRTGRMSKGGDREEHDGPVYLSGDVPISKHDRLLFEGESRAIQRLWAEYEGPKVSLWVVYF